MDKLSELLKYIQKTNPQMTKDKLIEELSISQYSTMALIMTWQNSEKAESLSV